MTTRQRQAFGQLTNQIHAAKTQPTHNAQPLKPLTIGNNNDENDYQQQINSAKSTGGKNVFEFEIYKDFDVDENMITEPVAAAAAASAAAASVGKENNSHVNGAANLANLIKKQPLQAHCNNLMDMSTLHSPMMLDDTIKFAASNSMSDEDLTASSDDIDALEEDEEMDVRKKEAIERENILMNCEEYAREIIVHLKQLEQVNRPKSSYLKQQQDITSTMRSILVDWLVEVSEEYKLHTETLYLAVNYTDRFLSKMSVLRGKLQLLGTAAMYIAAKYEEIFPPDVAEFVYITDDTYTKQQVLRMEHLILKVLNFHMNAPTANCFLLHFLRYCKSDAKTEHLSRYLAELTLVEAEPFLEYVPSEVASSALYLSMYTLGKKWTSETSALTGYTPAQLEKCIRDMHKCWQNAPAHPQQAIQEKYKQERYSYVSTIEAPMHVTI